MLDDALREAAWLGWALSRNTTERVGEESLVASGRERAPAGVTNDG